MKIILFFVIILLSSFRLIAQTGPGGIGNSTSNILWLRSDAISGLIDGDTITTWVDSSGNDNDFSQPVVALKPEYTANSVNGFPSVNFNVANSRLRRNPFTGFATNNITAIYVNKNNSESADGILSYASSAHNNNFLFFASQNIGIYRNSNVNTGISANDNNWHIVQGGWGSTNGNVELWKDGDKDYVGTAFNTGTSITSGGSLCLAHEQDAVDGSYQSSQDHIGEFTEVIVYNTYLDRSDHIILANYLAAKYDITLAAHDMYIQDNNANGDFDYEVAGIGRFDVNNFNDDAQGSAIVRILNPSGLDNGEYLFWGHNGAVSSATNTTDIPGTIDARYERVWRVNEVNVFGTAVDVGSVDMRWDLSTSGSVTASDLRLLVDTDDDGLFNDETPISGASSLGGDIYQFTGVTALVNNVRFTLATINSIATPLPIKLIDFTVQEQKNGTVSLAWKTATETNNEMFIIEKSKNGIDWEILAHVDGAGNSNYTISYDFTDREPYLDLSYYRLTQVDFDGTQSKGILRSVKLFGVNKVFYISPNPSNGKVRIEGTSYAISNIQIYNAIGQRVDIQNYIISESHSELRLDFSGLTAGVYFVKTPNETKKLIISNP
ncbi:MAG: T9SS type A sorting domain-containing protein [Crocinitomicaceae bacterium]